MPSFTDQMGNSVELMSFPPKRIVSLVPSQTELLYELGLGDCVAGQTIFCIHPADKFKSAVKVGGTKKLRIDVIRSLQPDLIIGNKEENEQSQVEQLQQEFPVWMSDIVTFADSLDMLNGIGAVTGKEAEAQLLRTRIEQAFDSVKPLNLAEKVLYLIWKNPYMAAGTATYIHQVLNRCGLQNVLPPQLEGKDFSRYPELSEEEIQALNPGIVMLSSEPYPFKDKHIEELRRLLPSARILLADGEMFSWYGSRMLSLPHYFNSEIAPQLS